jgi:hypothetical protein
MTTVLLAALAACAPATVDKQSVRATSQAPESTAVDVVRVPYEPSLPYYVVVVEPFTFDADGSPAGDTPRTPGTRYGWGPFGWGILPEGPRAEAYNPPPQGATAQMGTAIANQLVTALGNAGNIRIIEYDYFYQHRGKPSSLVRRNAREVGPFVIRGSVTEFNEIAEATGSSTGGSAGALGAALGVAGAIAGNRRPRSPARRSGSRIPPTSTPSRGARARWRWISRSRIRRTAASSGRPSRTAASRPSRRRAGSRCSASARRAMRLPRARSARRTVPP